MIQFILEIPLKIKIENISGLFIVKPEIEMHIENISCEFMTWGDPVHLENFEKELELNPNPYFIVNNLYGHYYYILLNKKNRELFIGNSMFSILPLYYHQHNDKIFFSENAIKMGKYLNLNKISHRFILETMLFNYPLFNNSIVEDIQLLPSNSFIKISSSGIFVKKHTKIEEFFSSSPLSWKKSVAEIRDIFLETIKKYLPDKPYAHALTGGFDGRTLVATGLFYKKKFSCYSFGSPESKDTKIASQLTNQAEIPFIDIELNKKYVTEGSFDCGQDFIRNSSGTATFVRAHYLFATRSLKENTDIIITGNFGSEIFRAAHITGVVISPNLYSLFGLNNPEKGINAIENSKEFKFLNRASYQKYWDALKNDILQLPCYNKNYSGFTQNQRFYVFVFEEIFRKYFGAEMINQFKYLKNRTPFLDINLLKSILNTCLAGIHADFFEHNPLKRYKGQVLYAHIIEKAYPAFGKILTDKGYRPDDLINFFGKVNILKGYLKKMIHGVFPDSDPFSVARAWEINKKYWNNIPVSPKYFNISESDNIDKEILFKIISLSYLIEKIKTFNKI